MIPNLVPVIGSRGAYVFLAPFNTLSTPGVEYICKGVRRISEYIANNEDPKKDVYDRYNLPAAIYDTDRENDAYIVSLQAAKGQWLYVPVRYIQTFPTGDGIQYRSLIISFAVPSIPVAQDITDLVGELEARIRGSLGTDVRSKIVQASQIVLVTKDRHDEKELERNLEKQGDGIIQRMVRLENEVAALLARNRKLEQYILENQ